MIRISNRLRAIAELVPADSRLVDVGTDHARLPVWLVQQGRVLSCIATDIREGPLKNAEELLHRTGTEKYISLRLTDGLIGVSRSEADVVVIAGMGGHMITSILDRTPWIMNDVILILSPHTKPEVLRKFLSEHSLQIHSELLTEDRGKIYPIITAKYGSPERCTCAELYTGRFEMLKQDHLFQTFISRYIKSFERSAPFDPEAVQILMELRNMQERLTAYEHSQ